jgi:hypothetical protein
MNRSMKWVLGCVLLMASWAMAQDAAKPWAASVKTGMQYSDNRDGTDLDKESNVDFYIQPRADLIWRDGVRTTLDVFLSPLAKWHSNPREKADGDPQNETELFGAVGVDLLHQVTPRVKVNAGDTLVYNDDPAIDEGGVGVRESASHILNTVYAALAVEVVPRVSLDVTGNNSMKRYEEEIVAQDQDEDIWDTKARLGYLLGAGYRVFGGVGYSDFSNKSTSRPRGSQVYSAEVGVMKIFNPDIQGTLSGGYQTASYSDEELDDTDTANAEAEMVFRAQSATRFRVGASYGFYAPYVRPYSLQTLTSVRGAIEHDVLPERLTMTLRGQYSNGEYDEEAEDLPGGSDELLTAGLSANYRISRTWSVGAGYTYETWDSDVRESFDRNYLDASVTAQF